MFTTRERIKISEILNGIFHFNSSTDQQLLRNILPIDKKYFFYANQGKAVFEQIIIAENLQNSKILLPAFFPDDFVGIFLKYNITPIFVDVNPDTYHISLSDITSEHIDKAKALILLHTFGLPANGNEYRNFCNSHGLILIEDCARALGASFKNELVGSFGHYSLFSLPKCTPVRQGGIALSEKKIIPTLYKPQIGLYGLLNSLVLVKIPLLSPIEGLLYNLLAGTPIYPLEVGNYNPLPCRKLDKIGIFILKCFLPHYKKIIKQKRLIAAKIKFGLEAANFKFQIDNGDHIFTSLSAEPPSFCDSNKLTEFLMKNGVKMSTMWREAIGIFPFSHYTWNAKPQNTPISLHLSKRLVQFPISRYQTEKQSEKIIELCEQFLSKC